MSWYHGSPSDHILRWHLVEHSPSICHAPAFYIYANQTILHKKIKATTTTLNDLFMNKPLPSSCAPKPTHALVIWTKVIFSRIIPSCHILQKGCITSSDCPSFSYFVSFLFHLKMLNYTMPGAIAAIFAATPGGFCRSSSVLRVYVWNPGTFHLPITENPDEADHPHNLHIPGWIFAILRTKKAIVTSYTSEKILLYSEVQDICYYTHIPTFRCNCNFLNIFVCSFQHD